MDKTFKLYFGTFGTGTSFGGCYQPIMADSHHSAYDAMDATFANWCEVYSVEGFGDDAAEYDLKPLPALLQCDNATFHIRERSPRHVVDRYVQLTSAADLRI